MSDVVNWGLGIDSFRFLIDDIIIVESRKGRKVDALAHGGDEGRDKLR